MLSFIADGHIRRNSSRALSISISFGFVKTILKHLIISPLGCRNREATNLAPYHRCETRNNEVVEVSRYAATSNFIMSSVKPFDCGIDGNVSGDDFRHFFGISRWDANFDFIFAPMSMQIWCSRNFAINSSQLPPFLHPHVRCSHAKCWKRDEWNLIKNGFIRRKHD